jgi:hypothetical protein
LKIAPYGLSTGSTSTSTQTGASPFIVRPDAGQMAAVLFGKRPPRLLDRKRHPRLRRALKKLDATADQIAEALGAPEEYFSIELAEGSNASINRQGQIAIGLELLEEHENDNDFLVGVLAHEIGHQPWTWPEGDLGHLTKKALDELYKKEEAKADRFCGKALADLGQSPESIVKFLLKLAKFEKHPPSDYYPAKERAELILQTFARRKSLLDRVEHLSPRVAQRRRELR